MTCVIQNINQKEIKVMSLFRYLFSSLKTKSRTKSENSSRVQTDLNFVFVPRVRSSLCVFSLSWHVVALI